jgi:hypothetical protein
LLRRALDSKSHEVVAKTHLLRGTLEARPVAALVLAIAIPSLMSCSRAQAGLTDPSPSRDAWGVSDGSGVAMAAASLGPPPEGFKLVLRSLPQTDVDGVIRGNTPVSVDFDACRSRGDAGKSLFFWFDWDFDNVADVGGAGGECAQQHVYRTPPNATGNVEIDTNICVANGDIRRHDPATFVACRRFKIVMIAPEVVPTPAPRPTPPPSTTPASHCHGINAANAAGGPVTCPTGAIVFCEADPIGSNDSTQAHDACDTCFGAGVCVHVALPPGGSGWQPTSPTNRANFVDVGGTNGCGVFQQGDITAGTTGCFVGRWAPFN